MSKYMQEIMSRLVDVPMARMFILASILFLLFAVLGRIEGKIEPGKVGRIGATLVGIFLLASGMAMHFNETDVLRDKLRENMSLLPPAPAPMMPAAPGSAVVSMAMAAPHAVDATERSGAVANPGIRLLSGTYGANCGARPGNATSHVARACDGQSRCEYRFDSTLAESTDKNCAGSFSAEWACGADGAVYAVSLPAGAAAGETLRLTCPTQ